MASLNLGSLVVDSSGRTVLSGSASGIDFKAAVDKLIEARRLPAVRLETKVTDNQAKIEAYKELRAKLAALRDVVATLRGAVTVDGTGNVFKTKKTFTSTSRTDGFTPSAAGNLLGVSVSNGAAAGVHELEVRRVAAAHKVASKAFTSVSTALGFAGSFTVGGQTVNVSAGDTLSDVRDRINTVNSGASASGVSASVVSVSATEHYLVLTKDATGSAMTLSSGGTILADLGISVDAGATFLNQIQTAQTARFTADGLIDADRYETDVLASSTAKLNTLFTPSNASGSFSLNGTVVNYNTANDSLTDIAARITANVANVTATVVADGDGFRMDVTTTNPSITVADTSGLLGDLGFDNDLIIERSSNSINDLFAGVTLSLFQPENGTKIKVEVEQDLSAAKSQIAAFVAAYNEVRRLINEQGQADPTTGAKGKDSGVLFSDSTMGEIRGRLANLIGNGVSGVSTAFSVLAQVGVKFVDNNALEDPLDKNTLRIDDAKLDVALLNNGNDVRKLFTFDFASGNSGVTLLDYGANTAFAASGYTLNVGTIGLKNKNSAEFASAAALLNDPANVAATASGTFTVNGAVIAYDITTDSLGSIVNKINATSVPGVLATLKTGAAGKFIAINSANGPLTLAGDTGDFLARANFQPDTSIIDSANIGGAADGNDNGTVAINGRTLTVTDASGAEGLKLFYSGTAAASGIDLDFTRGLATDLFFDLGAFTDLNDGSLQAAIGALEGENIVAEARVDQLDGRLALERESLSRKFIAMEAALQSLNRIRDQLTQYMEQSRSSR